MAEKKKIDLLQVIIEIGVITVGILIAYQLNNWNENRKTRNSELSILAEIKSNLELDLIDMSDNQYAHESAIQYIDSLRAFSIRTTYDRRTPGYFFSAFRDLLFLPQTSAFETLKAKGVDLITNDSLRIRILRLYDFNYNALMQMEELYAPGQFQDDFQYVAEKYFLNFDVNDVASIQPRYPGTDWLNNPDIRIRLDLIHRERSFYNSFYLAILEEVRGVIAMIDEELQGRGYE